MSFDVILMDVRMLDMDDYISKPVNADEFYAAVERWIGDKKTIHIMRF